MHRRSSVLALTVTVAVAGAGGMQPAMAGPAPKTPATAKPTGTSPAPASPAPAGAATSTPAARAEVQALLDAWLGAQNQSDFAAYQQLYADKLEGIKRVGARTWRFDRAGWLADRQRMFKRPMTVTARDVEISGSARTPVVTLVQTFKQGAFSDEGPKRLVLARGAHGLRIAREEMLASVVAGQGGRAPAAAYLTMTVGDQAYAVLADRADPSWAIGALEGPMAGSGGASFALREASKGAAAAGWKGRQLSVYSTRGACASATVRRVVLLGGGTPHFGEVQAWDGQDGAPALSPQQRARAVYDLAPPVLAAELDLDEDCPAKDTVLATEASPPAYFPLPMPGVFIAGAERAFRKLPAYRALQNDFARNYGGKGPWAPELSARVLEQGTQRVVLVWAKQGSGCGEFYGALTAVFAIDKGDKLRLLTARDQAYFEPRAVLDLDGDGSPEIVGVPDDFSTVSALYQRSSEGYRAVRAVSFPFNDCGC